MRKLSEILPIINIFKWADGESYTVEDDNHVIMPNDLAESYQKIEEEADRYFGSPSAKGGSGRSKYRVDDNDLIQNKTGQEKKQQEKTAREKGGRSRELER